MRLHEAIRLGAMNKPQGRGSFNSAWGTCAIGAALDAVGLLSKEQVNMATAVRQWPVLDKYIQHPRCNLAYIQPLRMTIVELNDVHGWTRERIAEGLQPIEETYEASRLALTDDEHDKTHVS